MQGQQGTAYRACLVDELTAAGLRVSAEITLPIHYKGRRIDGAYRADLIVEGSVLLELKAVDRVLPIHEAQTLTYVRLANLSVGLLLNFNAPRLKDGIHRFIA